MYTLWKYPMELAGSCSCNGSYGKAPASNATPMLNPAEYVQTDLTGLPLQRLKTAIIFRMIDAAIEDPAFLRVAFEAIPPDLYDSHNATAIIQSIEEWIQRNVGFAYELGEWIRDPRVTLVTGGGDCDDHTTLALAMANALGLDARPVWLEVKPNGPTGQGWHIYAQAWDGDQWVNIDSSLPEGQRGYQRHGEALRIVPIDREQVEDIRIPNNVLVALTNHPDTMVNIRGRSGQTRQIAASMLLDPDAAGNFDFGALIDGVSQVAGGIAGAFGAEEVGQAISGIGAGVGGVVGGLTQEGGPDWGAALGGLTDTVGGIAGAAGASPEVTGMIGGIGGAAQGIVGGLTGTSTGIQAPTGAVQSAMTGMGQVPTSQQAIAHVPAPSPTPTGAPSSVQDTISTVLHGGGGQDFGEIAAKVTELIPQAPSMAEITATIRDQVADLAKDLGPTPEQIAAITGNAAILNDLASAPQNAVMDLLSLIPDSTARQAVSSSINQFKADKEQKRAQVANQITAGILENQTFGMEEKVLLEEAQTLDNIRAAIGVNLQSVFNKIEGTPGLNTQSDTYIKVDRQYQTFDKDIRSLIDEMLRAMREALNLESDQSVENEVRRNVADTLLAYFRLPKTARDLSYFRLKMKNLINAGEQISSEVSGLRASVAA